MPEDAPVPQRQGLFVAHGCRLSCQGRHMPGQRRQQHGAGIGQLLPARRIQPGHTGQDNHRRILAPGRQTATQKFRIVGQHPFPVMPFPDAQSFRLFRRHQDHRRRAQSLQAQDLQGEQHMVERAQAVAAHQQDRQIQGRHEIQRVFFLIDGDSHAARTFHQQQGGLRLLPVGPDILGQPGHRQALPFFPCRQMRRGGQTETVQGRRRRRGQGRQVGHGTRVGHAVGQSGGRQLLRPHTGLDGLEGLGRHAPATQGPQQGRRERGLAHVRPGAGHEKSLYGAPVAGATRCHLSSTHGRATSSPAASIMRMSSSTPMPCVVR